MATIKKSPQRTRKFFFMLLCIIYDKQKNGAHISLREAGKRCAPYDYIHEITNFCVYSGVERAVYGKQPLKISREIHGSVGRRPTLLFHFQWNYLL
jgi:hypothetical protein